MATDSLWGISHFSMSVFTWVGKWTYVCVTGGQSGRGGPLLTCRRWHRPVSCGLGKGAGRPHVHLGGRCPQWAAPAESDLLWAWSAASASQDESPVRVALSYNLWYISYNLFTQQFSTTRLRTSQGHAVEPFFSLHQQHPVSGLE